MVSVAQFLERSMKGGYSADEIRNFLETAAKRDPKQKQALKLLDTATDTMAKEEKSSKSLGEVAGQAAKTAAGVAIPAALTYATAGPIAGAIGGMGAEAAGALGAGEAMAGEAGAGLSQMLKNMNPKDLMNLWNTYQKKGAGATLAQFAQSQMKGKTGADAMAHVPELPPEIQKEALKDFQQQGNLEAASALTDFRILVSGRHPLKNLASSIERKSGRPFREIVFDFLSQQTGGQPQQPPTQAQGMSQNGDLQSMPDDQLMALMKQRGLL